MPAGRKRNRKRQTEPKRNRHPRVNPRQTQNQPSTRSQKTISLLHPTPKNQSPQNDEAGRKRARKKRRWRRNKRKLRIRGWFGKKEKGGEKGSWRMGLAVDVADGAVSEEEEGREEGSEVDVVEWVGSEGTDLSCSSRKGSCLFEQSTGIWIVFVARSTEPPPSHVSHPT